MHGPRLRQKTKDRHGRNHLFVCMSSLPIHPFIFFFFFYFSFSLSVNRSHCLILLASLFVKRSLHINSLDLFVSKSVWFPSDNLLTLHFLCAFFSSLHLLLPSCSLCFCWRFRDIAAQKPQHSHNSKHLWNENCGLNNGFRLPGDQITHSSSLPAPPSPCAPHTSSMSHAHKHFHGPVPIIKIYVNLLIFQSLSPPSTWQS